MIKRALISLSNKENIVPFAKGLVELGVEILSTGGTAKLLEENGIPVTEVSQVTNFPECLDGRVKTLHPAIHGGILARRDLPSHRDQRRIGHQPIDMVVVNLIPLRRPSYVGPAWRTPLKTSISEVQPCSVSGQESSGCIVIPSLRLPGYTSGASGQGDIV